MKLDLQFIKDHSLEDNDVFFEMNALVGELGELANAIKKEHFYGVFATYKAKVDEREKEGAPSFREQQVDEAGDTFFYFMKVLNKKGISLEEVVEYQRQKLAKQSTDYGRIYKK